MEETIKILLENLGRIEPNSLIDKPENEQVLKLAFIGDTIFDIFTRDILIRKYHDKIKMNELHKKNTELVCAKSQARFVERLIEDKVLSDDEIDYYKHARNAHSHSKSKNSSIVDYRKATGLESLLGCLFYQEKIDRIIQILSKVSEYIE